MVTFLNEYLWTLFTLASFAIAGGFALAPFRNTIKYPIFTAPLAGLLMITLSTSLIYNLLDLSLIYSALISAILCSSGTCISAVYTGSALGLPKVGLAIFASLLIAFITYITNYTTLSLGHPGFLYMDGTDHIGYAHLADWLNNHISSERPVLSLDTPYQGFPNFIFNKDARFGSFFLLGILSDLRNLSAMFSYDFACGVILSAAILAISALFSRSSLTFFLLLLGLATTHWFDYSRSGYLGKLISFPSSFFVISLFLMAERPFTIPTIAVLACLSCASTIMHSFLSTSLIFLVIGVPFLLAKAINSYSSEKNSWFTLTRDNGLVLALLIGIVIATTGSLSRPALITTFPKHPEFSWGWLLPRVFDLEYMDAALSTFSSHQILIALSIFLFIYLVFLTLGIIKKNTITTALIMGPLILLSSLIYLNEKSEIYQLIGTFYPWFLAAAVIMLDELSIIKTAQNKWLLYGLLLLLSISILLHLPRLVGATERFAGSHINKTLQYSKTDFDHLSSLLNGLSVTIDIADPNQALPLLVELGKHQETPLYWTKPAGKTIFAFWPSWSPSKINKNDHLWLVLDSSPQKDHCQIKVKISQYNLIECR